MLKLPFNVAIMKCAIILVISRQRYSQHRLLNFVQLPLLMDLCDDNGIIEHKSLERDTRCILILKIEDFFLPLDLKDLTYTSLFTDIPCFTRVRKSINHQVHSLRSLHKSQNTIQLILRSIMGSGLQTVLAKMLISRTDKNVEFCDSCSSSTRKTSQLPIPKTLPATTKLQQN